MFRGRAARIIIPSIGGAAAIYYATDLYKKRNSAPFDSTGIPFDVPYKAREPDGTIVTKQNRFVRLSQQEIERKLTENQASYSIPRAGTKGGRWRYDTASVASNDPIEDAHAEVVIRPGEPGSNALRGGQTDPDDLGAPRITPPKAGDMLFFAIMDGHSGYHTSRLLSKTLIPAVALELASLSPALSPTKPKGWVPWLRSFWERPTPEGDSNSSSWEISYPFASDPKYVSTAIQTAFANLDSHIINAPIRHVNALKGPPFDKNSDAYQLALANLLPALSGSCALLAVLDQAREDLYVACTGDSRAVAGHKESTGKWVADDLSVDQTGRSESEHKRIQSEHPADESAAVIQRGRIFGGLEPTRAFGDARYKWPKAFQDRLVELFSNPESGLTTRPRPPPNDLKTPPYVTSRPEVTHRKVSFSSAPAKDEPRFIVLATDGLWDRLSSQEVTEVVGEYLDGQAKSTRVYSNAATHLIRNALSSNDPQRWGLTELMSIPAPHARRWRDDITVTIVWWEDGTDAEEGALVKAKL